MRTFEIDGLKLTVGVDEFDLAAVDGVDGLDYNIAILECMKEGMKVEWHSDASGWIEWVDDSCNFNHHYYRIVPKPKEPEYRPYSEVKIEWLGKVVIRKDGEIHSLITSVVPKNKEVNIGHTWISPKTLFERFNWADGSPFGEEVENENI